MSASAPGGEWQERTSALTPVSLRDPAGRLVEHEGRLLRLVREGADADFREFAATERCAEWIETGTLSRTRTLPVAEWPREPGVALVLEHERIPFPSYPFEWAPQMLAAAGALTLELARSCLQDGFGLKDATPYNVLFSGSRPVFVDWLSFERRDPCDPLWLPYAQFVRTFLLPLLAERDLGVPLSWSLGSQRDGIEPESLYRMLGPLGRLRGRYLKHVTLPTWFGGGSGTPERQETVPDPQQARFVLGSTLRGLERSLGAVSRETRRSSSWSDYAEGIPSYARAEFRAKERFVSEVLGEVAPARVLDVGCNAGHFSLLAARSGASVVAVDADPVVVGRTYQRARAEQLDVLPLVADLTRPSPAQGWRNRETLSFLDRARGHADLSLWLAVVHHLLVTGGIPLEEILDLAAELSREAAVIEWVEPRDPLFQRICRGRDALYADLDAEQFERAATRRFDVVRCVVLEGGTRRLYWLRKRA